jgi:hypothetical protein
MSAALNLVPRVRGGVFVVVILRVLSLGDEGNAHGHAEGERQSIGHKPKTNQSKIVVGHSGTLANTSTIGRSACAGLRRTARR